MHPHPLYLLLGAVVSHTQFQKIGFRQREVRFFAELFSNWVQVGGMGAVVPLHNTQISRYLESLVEDGQAKKLKSSTPTPLYKLTRAGIFTILSKVIKTSYLNDRHDCYLVWYFLKSYSNHLKQAITQAGSEFSKAQQIEMEELLNLESFISLQIAHANNELLRLNERITTAHRITSDVRAILNKAGDLESCISHVSLSYPYELNSQRPFKELLGSLPQDIVMWEIGEGSALRSNAIFEPIKREIERHIEHLQALRKTSL